MNTAPGTVESAQNDLGERRISCTDQPVKGDCCQRESDPASCFLNVLARKRLLAVCK